MQIFSSCFPAFLSETFSKMQRPPPNAVSLAVVAGSAERNQISFRIPGRARRPLLLFESQVLRFHR